MGAIHLLCKSHAPVSNAADTAKNTRDSVRSCARACREHGFLAKTAFCREIRHQSGRLASVRRQRLSIRGVAKLDIELPPNRTGSRLRIAMENYPAFGAVCGRATAVVQVAVNCWRG